LPVGILLDRYPIKRIGLIFFCIAILATLLMSYVENFWLLCLLRFLQGLASSASLLIIMRLGNSLFSRNVNRNIGLMILLALSGGIAGNSVFAYLALKTSWQTGLIIISALGFCLMTIMACGLREDKHPPKKSWDFRQLLKKEYLIAGINLGILNSPVYILGSLFGNQYMMSQTNLSLEQAAYFSSLLFTGIIIGSPILGYLADKLGNIKLISMGYIGLIILSMILSVCSSLSYFQYLFIFFGFGFFCCSQNLIYPLIYQTSHLRSSGTGIAAIISNGLGAFLQAAFGFITLYSTPQNHSVYQALLLIFILGFVTSRFYQKQ